MASQPEINLQCEASRKIDQLLDLEQQPRDRLGQLCRAMLTHQGADLRNLSNSDVVSRVLSPSPSGRDQQFFAAVFLRLLSVLPKEVHDLDNHLRLGVTRLLEKVRGPSTEERALHSSGSGAGSYSRKVTQRTLRVIFHTVAAQTPNRRGRLPKGSL